MINVLLFGKCDLFTAKQNSVTHWGVEQIEERKDINTTKNPILVKFTVFFPKQLPCFFRSCAKGPGLTIHGGPPKHIVSYKSQVHPTNNSYLHRRVTIRKQIPRKLKTSVFPLEKVPD